MKFPVRIPINEKEVMVLYQAHFFFAFTWLVCFGVFVYILISLL